MRRASRLGLTASSRTGLSAYSRSSRWLAPRGRRPRPKRGCAGQTRRGLGCPASAARRFAADREQRGAALGAVALPAGTTVGQGHLPRVGDVDLFAADAPGLRPGCLCFSVPRAPLTHARQAYSRLASCSARPSRVRGECVFTVAERPCFAQSSGGPCARARSPPTTSPTRSAACPTSWPASASSRATGAAGRTTRRARPTRQVRRPRRGDPRTGSGPGGLGARQRD
jgi:hypothetical protein